MSLDLSDRYGTRRSGQRVVLIAASAVLTVVFLVWLGWVAWFHASPEVQSEMMGFTIQGEHTATAVVSVELSDVDDANCKLRALAQDHVVVGEHNFSPVDGRNEVEIRTDRKADSIDLVGCTSPDQPRPR
ncbi:MAG TPA: DUF4307 domain-containing protein [Nocardioides sp.]|uniref:DNA-binding transcriptional regulator of glucitol operon n=1 Tax=Nocardioides daedukensis TaxID=634462 RepID=A0A7Y9S0W7_9ACTN|nr:DNA-binding transcriptional regulator of glucitol operon [Nocardioides daedukensis]